MKPQDFDAIIGIDQTGAIKPNGQPKPLPTALLVRDTPWRLVCRNFERPLALNFLKLPNLTELLEAQNLSLSKARVLVVVDSVIGLPKALQKSACASSEIRKAITETRCQDGYGAKCAENFFSDLLKRHNASIESYPKREVELQLGANSVFRARPFQKNIQTGTYRVWKDLSSPFDASGPHSPTCTLDKVSLWPFESTTKPNAGMPILLEGYPTLAWRLLNNSQRGQPLRLDPNLKAMVQGLQGFKRVSADHQDAIMLCLLALTMLRNQTIKKRSQKQSLEGDILGSHLAQ
jgi:hypothetical protein